MKTLTPRHDSHGSSRQGARTATATQPWPMTIRGSKATPAGIRQADTLHDVSRRGLWSLLLFLLISCAAFMVKDFDLYATFPESVLVILGCPPPPTLALLALAGYVFTVLTPLTIHLLSGDKPTAQWRHLGYRSTFYLFFLWSGTLTANFLFVFATGLALYLLEQLTVCVAQSRADEGTDQPA